VRTCRTTSAFHARVVHAAAPRRKSAAHRSRGAEPAVHAQSGRRRSPLELSVEGGLVPTGFASATGGRSRHPTERGPVSPIVLRSGPGPTEGWRPRRRACSCWGPAPHGNSSKRAHDEGARTLAPRTLVAPFTCLSLRASTFSSATRSFSPGQPQWASVYSTGGAARAHRHQRHADAPHVLTSPCRARRRTSRFSAHADGAGERFRPPRTQPSMDVVTIDLLSGNCDLDRRRVHALGPEPVVVGLQHRWLQSVSPR